jgi:hypothetical protein
MVVSLTLAAVTAAVSGSPPPSQTRWSLLPGLPRSTGFAPTWSPHAWRARSWCPHSPASSPADPPPPAGRGPGGGGHRTRRLGPLGEAPPAGRWRAAAELPGGQQPPGRGGTGHVHDRGEAVAVGDGTVPVAVRRAGRGWQQRFHQRPQLVRHEVVDESRYGVGSCHTRTKERNDLLKVAEVPSRPWTEGRTYAVTRCGRSNPASAQSLAPTDRPVRQGSPPGRSEPREQQCRSEPREQQCRSVTTSCCWIG